MRQTRSILESQNSRQVEVPWATLCGERRYLAEKRLKINIDTEHNQQLYLSNLSLFDDAVREMTRLYSKAYISGLVVRISRFSITEGAPRYDNIPLYISKGKGCVGLIDLENITFSPSPEGLSDLAAIFPCHKAIIQDEATTLGMNADELSSHYSLGNFKWIVDLEMSKVQQLRVILNEQGSKCISVVPEMLPDVAKITRIMSNQAQSQRLYISQPQLFDQAVRELTRLCSRVTFLTLEETSTIYEDPYFSIAKRVSTSTLLLLKKGMICLNKIKNTTFTKDKDALAKLSRAFPLHQDMIIKQARQSSLESTSSESLFYSVFTKNGVLRTYYEKLFNERQEYLKANQLDRNDLSILFEFSQERQKEVLNEIEEFLVSNSKRSYLEPHPFEAAAKELAPKICTLFITLLKACLQECAAVPEPQPLLDLRAAQLELGNCVHRVARFKRIKLLNPFIEWIDKEPLMQTMGKPSKQLAWDLAISRLPIVLSGKEIFTYEPEYETRGFDDGHFWVYY